MVSYSGKRVVKGQKVRDMVGHTGKDTMLTASDVAHMLNVHINTLRRWSDKGIIKMYRIGPRGDRRFRQEDIASFLRMSEVKSK